MSKLSRDKGSRLEREIVAAHAALGIAGERVPLSGAARYRGNGGDIDLYVFGPGAAPPCLRSEGSGERRAGSAPGMRGRMASKS
jgi:hypothetical protein